MKYILYIVVILCIFTRPVFAEKIIVVADRYFPYAGDPGSDKLGYLIELVRDIFINEGYTIEYKMVPWKRALHMVKTGKADCIVGAYADDAKNLGIKVPQYETGVLIMHFFAKKGTKGAEWTYDGTERSLEKIKLGVINGYEYGPEFDPYILSANNKSVQIASGIKAQSLNIKKLLAGRIDVVIEEQGVFVNLAKKMKVLEQIVDVGKEKGTGNKNYTIFSKKNPKHEEYTEIFAKGMKAMRESGKLHKILDKYGRARA